MPWSFSAHTERAWQQSHCRCVQVGCMTASLACLFLEPKFSNFSASENLFGLSLDERLESKLCSYAFAAGVGGTEEEWYR